MTVEEALHEVCESWNHLDPGRLAELFTDDGRFEDPLKESVLVGQREIREGNAPAMAALERCEVTLDVIVADGARAFAEGFFKSSLAGGGRLDFRFAMLVEMEGTRVKRVAEYFDTRPLIP
jgi:ketosteroid isomerase-like protein